MLLNASSDQILQEYLTPMLMQQGQQGFAPQAPQVNKQQVLSQALLNLGATMAAAEQKGLGFGQALSAGANSFGSTIAAERERAEIAKERQADRMLASYKDLYQIQLMQEEKALKRAREQEKQDFLVSQGVDPNLAGAFPGIAADRLFNPAQRRIVEQGGIQYYADTGEPVIANPVNQPTANLSKGEEAVDREFAKEFVAFNAAGGYADTDKQLAQLEDVVTQLESGENLTGPLIGRNPYRDITNPSSINAQELVEEVVQRNLRVILGAQFTEKEGERLISRAYNPKLDEKVNAKRLRALIGQIRGAAQAKQSASDYFRTNGTLKGWEGKMPSLSSFSEEEVKTSGNAPQSVDPEIWDVMTEEERALFQ